ncbi:protein tramtrack, alpha isoform-like isoform X3 [Macrosteles quadrilineatus]|uniref:protein tramtrack, alpha isoform-like isoform X3 n=1 Tax=Macrosteles quadrilineatus TaxID=74068 RepID=UPI0023E2A31E|nr:protein tramtrack, alpha isoform-like isoform X3 [Macrosteles quadrilineatus]
MADQQFCLRWNNHQSTLISVFDTLLENGTLVDCTLAAEGQYLKAHKVVLCACSPYLEALLSQHYEKHPIVILKDVKFSELKSMMDYMYRGEVNISQDQLGTFLKAAESLQIKGLSDNGADGDARDVGSTPKAPPPRKPNVPAPSSRSEPARPDSPLTDGSMSPSSRKRRRVRRSSQDEDSHIENNCDLPSQAQSTPVPNIPAATSSITTTPIVKPAIVKPEQTEINRVDTNSLPADVLKKEIEPISEPLLEPKTEYLEDVNNEDSVEDLTLDDDDDMDGMDISNMSNMSNMSRPGPSHGNDISNQGFAAWNLGANQSGTDEVFMAAQEAVNQHRDSQDQSMCLESQLPSKSNPQKMKSCDLNIPNPKITDNSFVSLEMHVSNESSDDESDEISTVEVCNGIPLKRALPILELVPKLNLKAKKGHLPLNASKSQYPSDITLKASESRSSKSNLKTSNGHLSSYLTSKASESQSPSDMTMKAKEGHLLYELLTSKANKGHLSSDLTLKSSESRSPTDTTLKASKCQSPSDLNLKSKSKSPYDKTMKASEIHSSVKLTLNANEGHPPSDLTLKASQSQPPSEGSEGPPPSEVLPGRREGHLVYHDGRGYYYKAELVNKSNIRSLQCLCYGNSNQKCRARAVMHLFEGAPILLKKPHNHPPDFGRRDLYIVTQILKERIKSEPNMSVTRLIRRVARKNNVLKKIIENDDNEFRNLQNMLFLEQRRLQQNGKRPQEANAEEDSITIE